jgi:hypothetical protein
VGSAAVSIIPPHSLIIEATLRPPPIRGLFSTNILPIALNGRRLLNSGFGPLMAYNFGGINHPNLLIPLGKFSLPLELPVLLELPPNLFLILLGLLLPYIVLN